MSYRLNKTNGDLLIDLVDGQIDTTSTDLTLVGRNYKGFGEFLNENFIGLLENFSSTAAPSNPLTGQLWFDTSEQRMKLYDGTTFKAAGGPILSNTIPQMVAGDLWIDTQNQQMYFFDGNSEGSITLVGPQYSKNEQKTGFEVDSVIDTVSQQRTILKLFIENRLVGVFTQVVGTGAPGSNDTFFIDAANAIPGYPEWADDPQTPRRQRFQDGFNPVDMEFWYRGTATTARSLTDDVGNEFTDANFMRTDANTSTTGSIKVKNSAGISVGIGDTEYSILKVDPGSLQTILENQQQDTDLQIRVRQGNIQLSSLYIDTSEARVGIWNTNPTVDFDVTGDGRFTGNLEVEGNLIVQGDTTVLNTSTLRVEDKNIELGLLDDSTEGNNTAVDGAGIIVRSSEGSKDWTWTQATKSWTSNQDINIITSIDNAIPEYKINGSSILNATTLSSSVTTALGLTQIGTLQYLDVDNINLNGVTITTTGAGLNLTSAGPITVNTQKITGIAEPTTATDVATKNYVDTQIDADNIGFSLDITGFSSPFAPGINDGPYTNVAAVLQTLYPAATKNGATATVHCTSYAGVNITISQANLQAAITDNNAYISVDKDGNFSSESVLQDISISSAGVSGTASISPSRFTMTFTSNGVSWSHTGTSNYP
jgi:hypothetical protein